MKGNYSHYSSHIAALQPSYRNCRTRVRLKILHQGLEVRIFRLRVKSPVLNRSLLPHEAKGGLGAAVALPSHKFGQEVFERDSFSRKRATR